MHQNFECNKTCTKTQNALGNVQRLEERWRMCKQEQPPSGLNTCHYELQERNYPQFTVDQQHPSKKSNLTFLNAGKNNNVCYWFFFLLNQFFLLQLIIRIQSAEPAMYIR